MLLVSNMELVIGSPCSLGIHVGLLQLPHCKICDLVLLKPSQLSVKVQLHTRLPDILEDIMPSDNTAI